MVRSDLEGLCPSSLLRKKGRKGRLCSTTERDSCDVMAEEFLLTRWERMVLGRKEEGSGGRGSGDCVLTVSCLEKLLEGKKIEFEGH